MIHDESFVANMLFIPELRYPTHLPGTYQTYPHSSFGNVPIHWSLNVPGTYRCMVVPGIHTVTPSVYVGMYTTTFALVTS
jgi:hypothetical protein